MTVRVKICGLQDSAAALAAVEGGAAFVGFVFCAESRHCIDAQAAAALIQYIPSTIISVGLFVDPSDEELEQVLAIAPLRMIQLHGSETPARAAQIRKQTNLPILKAVGIGSAQDVEKARTYEAVADMLLLDAKPVQGGPSGGNGVVFDWALLKGASFAKPWMLAGGLHEGNIGEAVAMTGASILDVSTGVEDASGRKSASKIKAFLDRAKKL